MRCKSWSGLLGIVIPALLIGIVLGVAIGRTRTPFGAYEPTIQAISLDSLEQEPHPIAIRVADLQTLLENKTPVTIIDVREPQEFNVLHIANSVSMPLGSILAQESEIPRDRTVVVYCMSDLRGEIAARELGKLGFTNVRYLDEGFSAWQNAGLKVSSSR